MNNQVYNTSVGKMNLEYCLPRYYINVPIKHIRMSARTQMEKLLNDKENSIIESHSGLMNNYCGLAELVGFSNEQIRFISSTENPTSSLLELWEGSAEFEPKLGKLWEYLIELKRFDVMKECRKAIDKDVTAYQARYEREMYSSTPVQDMEVTTASSRDDHYVNETLVLTTADVDSKVPQYYDAFVCYNYESNEDVLFVRLMARKLEEQDLKLCVPGRDNLPGAAQFTAYAELIKSRCRMMIIVLSNEYLKSSACEFQVKFAQALSPCTQKKRIVPVLIEPMEIPDVLRYMSLCDFTKKDLMKWFWDRLARSLRQPVDNYWSDDVSLRDSSQSDNTSCEATISTNSGDTQNDLNSPGISMNSSLPSLPPVNVVWSDSSSYFPITEPVGNSQDGCRFPTNSPLNIKFNNMEDMTHFNIRLGTYDDDSLHSRGPSKPGSADTADYELKPRASANFRNITNENGRSRSPESNVIIQNNSSPPKSNSRIRDKFPDLDAIIKKQKKMK